MPDDNKPITDTSLPGTGVKSDVSSVPPPISPLSDQKQTASAPSPFMQDGSYSPPPPIVEEEKPEEATAPTETAMGESPVAPSIPPVVTTSGEGGRKFGGKKVVATILGVLVLVGGIGAGVVLVQNQQDIREKAYMTGPCRQCINDKCQLLGNPPNCNPAENKCTYDSDCVEPPEDGDTGGTDTGGSSGGGGSKTKTCSSVDGECVTTTATACLTIGRESVDGSCPTGQLCCQISNTCASRGGECVFAAGNCNTLGRESVNGSCSTGFNCCKPANPCTGECIATNAGSCYALGKESAGGDCALGQICCKESSSSTGGGCTNSANCGFQKLCVSGTCQSVSFCDSDSCSIADGGRTYSDTCYVNHYHTDDADDSTVNDVILKRAVASSKLGLKDCGAEQIDVTCDGNPYADGVWKRYDKDCTPQSTPTSGLDCQCLDIKVFDEEWSQLSVGQLISLEAGNVVRFTVSGVSSAGAIDMARFTINGVLRPEVTAKRPGTNEFYDEYTIPEGVSSFTINAELHHSTIGWF